MAEFLGFIAPDTAIAIHNYVAAKLILWFPGNKVDDTRSGIAAASGASRRIYPGQALRGIIRRGRARNSNPRRSLPVRTRS